METAYWSLVSWKVGLEQDPHGTLLTAAVGLPGGVPEQPGAGDAALDWEQGGFQHVDFAAVLLA